MKKTFALVAAATLMLAACGTGAGTASNNSNQAGNGSVLGGVLAAVANGNAVGNILQSFIGSTTVKAQDLVGTWNYSTPGCAFSTENMLAKAGGEVAAAEIKQKLASPFSTVGIKKGNTSITFNSNNTFTATVAGKQMGGNYTFDEATQKITLQMLLLNVNCYAKKNSDGIGILFESSKLLTLLQTAATLSGNSTLNTLSDLSKHYDGVRMGFDMTK